MELKDDETGEPIDNPYVIIDLPNHENGFVRVNAQCH